MEDAEAPFCGLRCNVRGDVEDDETAGPLARDVTPFGNQARTGESEVALWQPRLTEDSAAVREAGGGDALSGTIKGDPATAEADDDRMTVDTGPGSCNDPFNKGAPVIVDACLLTAGDGRNCIMPMFVSNPSGAKRPWCMSPSRCVVSMRPRLGDAETTQLTST